MAGTWEVLDVLCSCFSCQQLLCNADNPEPNPSTEQERRDPEVPSPSLFPGFPLSAIVRSRREGFAGPYLLITPLSPR